jgi:tRNA A-37 threonylcarbamoyl transferase component Bud32
MQLLSLGKPDNSPKPNMSAAEYAGAFMKGAEMIRFIPTTEGSACDIKSFLTIAPTNEEEFNGKITPLLQVLSSHDPTGSGIVLCNSERIKWLPGISSDYKPDFHVNHLAFNENGVSHHAPTDNSNYLFGGVNQYYISEIGFIFEGKFGDGNLTATDQGKIFHYLSCMLQSGNVNPCGLLYNCSVWQYFEYKNSLFTNVVIHGKWSDNGCKEFIQKKIRSSNMGFLSTALHLFSIHKDLKLRIGGWLGKGADGHVFLVHKLNGEPLAMKIKLHGSMEVEYNLLCNAYNIIAEKKDSVPNIVQVRSPYYNMELNNCNASCFLMEIGDKISREHISNDFFFSALECLVSLHLMDLVHGDPRLDNIMTFNGVFKWIDMRQACSGIGCNQISKAVDLKILLMSRYNLNNMDAWFETNKNYFIEYGSNPTLDKAMETAKAMVHHYK